MQSSDFLFSPAVYSVFVIVSIVFFLFTFFFLIRLFRKTKQLEERQKMFLKGKHGADLESVIVRHDQEIGTLDSEIQDLAENIETVRKLADIGIHKVGIVRFNPFQDTGSNQSFSIALLDGGSNGIVISSLLSRESGRVYAKPVIQGNAKDFPFTAEEKHAIQLAQKSRELPQKTPAIATTSPK